MLTPTLTPWDAVASKKNVRNDAKWRTIEPCQIAAIFDAQSTALDGIGFARLPCYMINQKFQSGKLVSLIAR